MQCKLRMYQYEQNELNGLGTAPEFEKGMDFCVHMDVFLIELEDCSTDKIENDESDVRPGGLLYVWRLETPFTYIHSGIQTPILPWIEANLPTEEHSLAIFKKLACKTSTSGVGLQ
jgi:hypothetical protein